MTNDKFKPFLNIPKTETKIVLTDWSQPVKKSKLSTVARSKVINRSGSNYFSESESHGPCYVCDDGESSPIEFKVACPAENCSDRRADYWHHNKDGCENSRMLITSWGKLSCGGCGVAYSMANWQFACSLHEGGYRSMSKDS
jgi:hypothetical protein